MGQIYFAVVQLVLLYRYKTWVMKPHIRRVLGRFHHRVNHRMTWRQHKRGRDGVWIYTLLEDGMAKAGLQEMEIYISRRQNTVTQFITTRDIMDLCLAAKQRPGPRISKR